MSPGSARLAGDPGSPLETRSFFIACPACHWLQVMDSVPQVCHRNPLHTPRAMNVHARCNDCGWSCWFGCVPGCSKSTKLHPHDVRVLEVSER